ncbi:MAG: crotonase/enoyl-CoA hydratase family protein [Candidatus Dormibacteraeota bacterium]|uniref:Crotonase/enoyl-CoA hydratase family protein n=1 Tax=Candidatus Aeolococcus gillhamiae TaxID=3127015 RepID=A0A2W5Z626_9BACT|nr:crotonase/enoyl-CoA hydratase family protein [Candidatus Dormibacteraeota bacterium]PZR78315.1 MAG: crotonase/enoyl-CoA hydratase family protein [Candidatus Dormibacter sp. RRmetagenome_bin12]
MTSVLLDRDGDVLVVTISRPEVRNAIDRTTADALVAAFGDFDADATLSTAVLTGAGGGFCAGADLRAVGMRTEEEGDAPLGVSRMLLGKPVIAAVEGHAVAGGLELALWCDLRVAAMGAVFGVYCRRFGVPLMDGGTIRLPRLVGQGCALDMILTGRPVDAEEALRIGLANRLVPTGDALPASLTLAHELAALPQTCLRSDRMSVHEQWSLSTADALLNETRRGLAVIASGETAQGAERFARGDGRHGTPIP